MTEKFTSRSIDITEKQHISRARLENFKIRSVRRNLTKQDRPESNMLQRLNLKCQHLGSLGLASLREHYAEDSTQKLTKFY